MKSRPPLFARLWRKLFPQAAPPPPVRLSSTERPLPARDRLRDRGIEPLEGRIAPAVLLPNGVDLQYKDIDGDLVTIHFSKSLFTAPPGGTTDTNAILASVFHFSTGSAHTGAPTAADDGVQQLQTIDLTKVRPAGSVTPATGVSITATAQKFDLNNDGTLHGDNLVNIGAISAGGIALGSISIGGDLGQIDAGVSTSAVAIQSLSVKTLGALTTTQAGTADYESAITGGIGSFTADSIIGGYLHVSSATGTSSGNAAVGNIGTVTIAHQIATRDASVATATNDGRLEVSGNIGTLLIGSGVRDAMNPQNSDGLFGGADASSGSVKVGGQITKLMVKGDLRGSTGTGSAAIEVTGSVATLQVDGSLLGSGTSSASITAGKLGTVSIGTAGGHGLLAGTGDGSAVVKSTGAITSAVISDIEGSGTNSGGLTAAGMIGSVTVNGYVKGGTGQNSGFIHSDSGLGTVKLVGDLDGGAGTKSGVISSGNKITSFSGAGVIGAPGGVRGSGLDSAGVTAAGKIGSITLTGSLLGGFGEHSGYLDSDYSIASITIKGSVEGASGVKSGTIVSASSIGPINITGHLKGGDPVTLPAVGSTPAYTNAGDLSGSITAGTVGFGGITSVTLGDGLLGGAAVDSGVISSAGTIGTATITRLDSSGHRLDAIVGGAGDSSGVLYSFGEITKLTVNGNVHGGAGQHSGSIQANVLKNVTVNGTLPGQVPAGPSGGVVGGAGDDSGAILALDHGTPGGTHSAGALGTVTIVGGIFGGDGLRSGVVSSDGAITSLSVGQLFQGTDASSGRIVSGAGLYGAGDIGTLTVNQIGSASVAGGSVLAYGAVAHLNALSVLNHGAIHVQDSIGAFVSNGLNNATVTAGGQANFNGKTDLAIGSITINGHVTNSSLEAGYGVVGDAENGHAQIGAVKVTGNWISSNLVAGVQDAGAAGFGDSGDQLISGNTSTVKARIASVMITGNLDATNGGQYGFVAQEIGFFHSSRGTLALNPAPGQSFNYVGSSGGKISIREVLPVG